METAVGQISNASNQFLPYRRAAESAISKHLRRNNVADDEDTNTAHEKRYGWQRKDVVSYVPGGSLLVGRLDFARQTK
jgi:hypothetical protein